MTTNPDDTQVMHLLRDVQSSVIVLTEWRKTKDKQDDKNDEQIGKLVEATHKLQVDFVVFRGMGGDMENMINSLDALRREVNESKNKTARNTFNLAAGTRALYGFLWLAATMLTTWLTAYFGSVFGPTNGGGS